MNKFYFNKVVVGGSLTAVLYAYKHNLPIIVDVPHIPFQLDECPKHWDLSFLGFAKSLQHKKSQVWDRMLFVMAMAGLVIFPNNIRAFRHEDNKIKIITLSNTKMEIEYKEIVEFDRDRTDEIVLYDWFAVRSGCNHEFDTLADPGSDFCHTLLFHPSTRKATRKEVKDVCAVSLISETELNELEYSEGYARIKTLQMMKDAGIRGQSNGYNKKGLQLHYAIKIEHMYREVYYKYNNGHNIEELLAIQLDNKSELWKLTQNLIVRTLST